jgi:hypothetical protein
MKTSGKLPGQSRWGICALIFEWQDGAEPDHENENLIPHRCVLWSSA